ncbi:MAG: hypothetical protein IPN24_14675 [Betaproteobacteria bacterium]|nr:hypothetical protein [Betaproteobacteria bacterium]
MPTLTRAQQERAEAAKRQAEQLQADLRRYREARAYFADLARNAVRFAPLSPTKRRWRGLRDD